MKLQGLFLAILPLILLSCKKWEDKKAEPDPQVQARTYCNDPEAVNYNWNFPGRPDSTICIYPADLYTGTFLYTDSVYRADNTFDSAGSLQTYTLQIFPLSRSRFSVLGFCGPSDTLTFTALRANFRAYTDTIVGIGQLLCRPQDTINGYFGRQLTDSAHLLLDFTVISDTGINFHRGTAIRQ